MSNKETIIGSTGEGLGVGRDRKIKFVCLSLL
jgi:hypothetical protein